MAACFDATNCAALLLRKRINVNALDDDGFSPLHLAAMRGSTGVAALLLKHKADPNVQVAETLATTQPIPTPWANGLAGCTALHLAALNGETNLMMLLLKQGVSIDTTNLNGLTALDLAMRQNWQPEPMFMHSDLTRVYGPLAGQWQPQTNWLQRLFDQRKVAADLLIKRGAQTASRRSY